MVTWLAAFAKVAWTFGAMVWGFCDVGLGASAMWLGFSCDDGLSLRRGGSGLLRWWTGLRRFDSGLLHLRLEALSLWIRAFAMAAWTLRALLLGALCDGGLRTSSVVTRGFCDGGLVALALLLGASCDDGLGTLVLLLGALRWQLGGFGVATRGI